jgi:hypothetical protein
MSNEILVRARALLKQDKDYLQHERAEWDAVYLLAMSQRLMALLEESERYVDRADQHTVGLMKAIETLEKELAAERFRQCDLDGLELALCESRARLEHIEQMCICGAALKP